MSAAEKAVEELFSTFRDFLYRDLFHVVGGVSIIAAFFYAQCRIEALHELGAAERAYLIVLGYVVGYAAQEACGVLRIISTAYVDPGGIIRFLGRRFAPADDWDGLPRACEIDMQALRLCVDRHMPTETRKRNQRTINLKQLCSSMGSAGLVSAFLLIIRALVYSTPQFAWLFAGILVVTGALIVMNKIKNAQQRMLELGVNQRCQECHGSAHRRPQAAAVPP